MYMPVPRTMKVCFRRRTEPVPGCLKTPTLIVCTPGERLQALALRHVHNQIFTEHGP